MGQTLVITPRAEKATAPASGAGSQPEGSRPHTPSPQQEEPQHTSQETLQK